MRIIFTPYTYLGLAIWVLSLLGVFWTATLFKETSIKPYEKPTKLMIKGLFKISKNPIYLCGVLFFLGLAIHLGSVITFIFPILFFIILSSMFIPYEEKNLEKEFGQDYVNYKKNVRRWI